MFLKQSTTTSIVVGPFLDKDDGLTPETGLAGSMTVKVSKGDGGALSTRNSATTITHLADGFYKVELNTTDTGTLGKLTITVTLVTTHLPVFASYHVVVANVYDALYGAGTDKLQVDAVEISSSTTAANNVESNIGNLDATVSSRSSHSAALVWSAPNRQLTNFGFTVTVGTNNDKTGYTAAVSDKSGFTLSTAGIDAIWEYLTSAISVAGSIGKLIKDNLNATVSSRSSHTAANVWTNGTRSLTDKAGFNVTSGSISSVSGSVGSVSAGVTVSTNNDKTGYGLSSSERDSTADALLDRSSGVEASWTFRQAMRVILAAVAGMVDGAGGSPVNFRDQADSKNRISATVDGDGNRTSITYDKS